MTNVKDTISLEAEIRRLKDGLRELSDFIQIEDKANQEIINNLKHKLEELTILCYCKTCHNFGIPKSDGVKCMQCDSDFTILVNRYRHIKEILEGTEQIKENYND